MNLLQSISFRDQVAGQAFDDAAFERDMAAIAPAGRCYVVMFTARSGSTWLSHGLTATGSLGKPGEYLNPNHVAHVARGLNAGTPARLLRMMRRQIRTANGVFGLFARHVDIEALGMEPFQAEFAETAVFFHLWRRDMVAQAVSLYRAVATRRFHSVSSAGTEAPPEYDAAGIGLWLGHLAGTENGNVHLLARFGVGARHLCYEEIVQDRPAVLARFGAVLDEPLAAADADAPMPEKIGDDWNAMAAARFRGEQAELVARTEAGRLILHGIAEPLPAPPDQPAARHEWQAGMDAGRAGSSPFAAPPRASSWRAGWQAGWDDQKRLAPESRVWAVPRRRNDPVPPDMPAEAFRLPENRPPRPLPGFTARRLVEILLDQERRGVRGGLLELGLSRGRQTRLLLAAAARTGEPLIAYAAGYDKLATMLGAYLHEEEEPLDLWQRREGVPVDAASLRASLAGGARLIAVEPARFGAWTEQCLGFAAEVMAADACLLLAGFLETDTLGVTEAVVSQARSVGLLPVALLPGRLLLCPEPVRPRYAEMIKAFALRDAQQTGAGKLAVALRKGETSRLSQRFCGVEVLMLG